MLLTNRIKAIEYNGQSIYDGGKITIPINSNITITGNITERDSVPDYYSI